MSDPFRDEVEAERAEGGPFRTNEPTRDARLAKAREASFDRVALATRRQLDADRRHERTWDRILWVLLGLSASALAVALLFAMVGDNTSLALLCPAVSAVVSFAIAVVRRRVHRPRSSGD